MNGIQNHLVGRIDLSIAVHLVPENISDHKAGLNIITNPREAGLVNFRTAIGRFDVERLAVEGRCNPRIILAPLGLVKSVRKLLGEYSPSAVVRVSHLSCHNNLIVFAS